MLRLLQHLIFKTIILRQEDSSGYHFSDFKQNDSSAKLNHSSVCSLDYVVKYTCFDATLLPNTFYGPDNENIGIQNQHIPM